MSEGMNFEREGSRALTVAPVSVIYVSVDEPAPSMRCRPLEARGVLKAAAMLMHRLADQVDEARRSFEQVRREV